MTEPITKTDSSFEAEVLEASTPVLVDFWAEWCMPCRMIAPVIQELAEAYGGKVKFAKLDVDANPITVAKYAIRSIPTLLIFKGGELADQVVGAVPRSVLKRRLEAVLSGGGNAKEVAMQPRSPLQ